MLTRNYFYGPVPSRRLGFSLGVNLFSKKTCSFNCLYCQLGPSSRKTTKRFSHLSFPEFKAELREIIEKNPKINYITISGSGEPTLHRGLDKIILAIKKLTKDKYPVAVITNSSLLYRKKVRDELRKADLIVPSLDAATEKDFSKINRPPKGITLRKIISGLKALRREFKGKIWLEIMLIPGVNDKKSQIEKFREIIKEIKPDKIQLNLPIRPAGVNPALSKISRKGGVKISLPPRSKIEAIKKALGKDSKTVVKFSLKKKGRKIHVNSKRDILNFLKVRPATRQDLVNSLAGSSSQIDKQLSELLAKKKIRVSRARGVRYFVIND